jgi:hypothetical protein
MKTNQIMIRDNSAFVQRTDDGYFNANKLLDSWNEKSNAPDVQMGNYKKSGATIRYINQLIDEGIENPMISGRGKSGGTWMHPKLFVDFAMYVSTEFKSIVIDYVLDGLIKSRHDAGDYYNEMCAAILSRYVDYYKRKPNPTIYQSEARRIKLLLGLSNKNRNMMSEKELSSITQMQKLNSILITRGTGLNARIKQLELQAELLKI